MDRQTQAVLSPLTLKCNLGLAPSNTVLALCTPTHNGKHLCQVMLNCDLDIDISQMVHCNAQYGNTHAYQASSHYDKGWKSSFAL